MHRGVTAPSWAGGGHPWEVHKLSPRCRGEHALFFPRVGHGDLRHHVHLASFDTPAFPLYGSEWYQKGFSLHQQEITIVTFYLEIPRKKRADERTRTAYPCSLRVMHHSLQGFAGACKCCIDKPFSLLCLAVRCTVVRSQWCQSGVNCELRRGTRTTPRV